MLNVLIVDDQHLTTIEKEIVNTVGCILNDNCNYKSYEFAHLLPNSHSKTHNRNDVAINGIIKMEQFDLAFLDLKFPKEVQENGDEFIPIKSLISKITEHHPFCEILITSQYQTLAVLKNYKPFNDIEQSFYSVPKSTGQINIQKINEAIGECLERRFRKLILNCTKDQISVIQKYLSGYINTFEFTIDKYKVTPEKLFFHFFDLNKNLDRSLIQEKWLELIYDVPKYKDEYWLCSRPPTLEQKKTILKKKVTVKDEVTTEIRKYPLKEYYFQYYRYFQDDKILGLPTVLENAEYAVKSVIDYLSKETTDLELRNVFLKYPAIKYTGLKLNNPKFSNRIPDEDMFKFSNFLTHRLLHFGLYFGANMSAPGINLLVDKNSYSTDPTGKFSVYLAIEKHIDQLHTETDSFIEKNKLLENVLGGGHDFRNGEINSKRPDKLQLLNQYLRKYHKLYENLANYEKVFIKNICEYSKNKKLPEVAKEHLDYIVANVL